MIYRIHHLATERIDCREADCEANRCGWTTYVDEATALGQQQAAYIRYKAGRQFKEEKTAVDLTLFHFPPGQQCFAVHTLDYANFQRRREREDYAVIAWDRFRGDWNETVATELTKGR